MRKVRMVFACILALTFFGGAGYASVTDYDSVRVKAKSEDTYQLEVQNSSGTRQFSVNSSGTLYAPDTKVINLPLQSFNATNDVMNTSYGPSLVSSVANLGLGAPPWTVTSSSPAVAWSSSFTTPIAMTFRVPENYSSSGYFKVLASQSAAGTSIDFDVFVNSASTAYDSSATNQSAVGSFIGTTSYTAVTLTPATDFASLAAGQYVTFRLWRNSGGSGTLYVHDVDFIYSSSR